MNSNEHVTMFGTEGGEVRFADHCVGQLQRLLSGAPDTFVDDFGYRQNWPTIEQRWHVLHHYREAITICYGRDPSLQRGFGYFAATVVAELRNMLSLFVNGINVDATEQILRMAEDCLYEGYADEPAANRAIAVLGNLWEKFPRRRKNPQAPQP
jgi:hypothetical protein